MSYLRPFIKTNFIKCCNDKFQIIPKRTYIGKEMKRFYKNVSISESEGGGYEINLDQRKLKTPLGTLFKVPTEPLALAVATEWQSQEDVVKRHSMHLIEPEETSLCNTAIENPTRRSRETVINSILEFLDTDTICYRVEEPEELATLQTEEWDPLINWCRAKYGVQIQATTGIGVPTIPQETREVFFNHLNFYNDWALVGYQYAVECVKSLIITACLVDRFITVEKAVQLSRLEAEFQIGRWGNVEWYHDIDLMSLRARLSSAILFIHVNSEDIKTIFHKKNLNLG